jgi:hypothetical protein
MPWLLKRAGFDASYVRNYLTVVILHISDFGLISHRFEDGLSLEHLFSEFGEWWRKARVADCSVRMTAKITTVHANVSGLHP